MYLLHILSHALALRFSLGVTYWSKRKYTTTIKITPNYTLFCSWASKSSYGCGCQQCTLSLLMPPNITKESKLQPPTTETVVVCECNFKILSISSIYMDMSKCTTSELKQMMSQYYFLLRC